MTGKWTRRTVAMGLLAGGALALPAPRKAWAAGGRRDGALPLTGDLTPVHDPAIIRAGDGYHLFSTSHVDEPPGLIHWRHSPDLRAWTMRGAVFPRMPEWTSRDHPESRGLWAPDIVQVNGEHRLYYSVSTFGRNESAIGMAVAGDLSADAPWRDHGPIFRSTAEDDFNAIDPAVFTDADGSMWMAFGSFWSGLKMFALDPATGLPSEDAPRLRPVARRPSPGAVEAPFVIEREGWHYLFASFGLCCRGAESTYRTVVGRSRAPAGPYLDQGGRDMMEEGGSLVLHADMEPEGRFAGPGHCAVLRDGDQDWIVYHAYDLRAEGMPTLRIRPIAWQNGWPVAY